MFVYRVVNPCRLKVLFFLLCMSVLCALSYASNFDYSSPEHIVLGNEVELAFDATEPGIKGALLHLPNELNLTYGHILALGDFYGIQSKPISSAVSAQDMKNRFMAAFNTLAVHAQAVNEVPKILHIMSQERKMVEAALNRGETEEAVYSQAGLEYERQYNCVTGGGCLKSTWWLSSGRYLLLAQENYDHFGDDALRVYRVGHELALAAAKQASQTHDVKKLELAYAINAFACHFLSDRYASGHMRTPRRQLAREVSPSLVGDILSGLMHNEENHYGLHVHNARGEHWVAYGDRILFSPKSDENHAHQLEALKLSAHQIFEAYQDGVAKSEDALETLIPYPDEMGQDIHQDIASLFYWDDQTQKLFSRTDLINPYQPQWTEFWWGWSTLLTLSNHKTLPTEQQAALALSELRDAAIRDGLITDHDVFDFISR